MKLERIAIIPDAHVPYHNKKAWKLMITALKDFKPDRIICLGDLADFYKISHYSKDPTRMESFDTEISMVNKALDDLDSLEAKHKIFIAGNHEDRLERYLKNKAPELFNLIKIKEILELGRRNWKYVPYKEHYKLGKVYYAHDIGTTSRYQVYKCLETYQHSIVTGHTHRFAAVIEGNNIGEFRISAQFGWLGDVTKIDYLHKAIARKNYVLGFGTAHLNPLNGITYFYPVPIINGTCFLNDKEYKYGE